jgi:hypothetical protein
MGPFNEEKKKEKEKEKPMNSALTKQICAQVLEIVNDRLTPIERCGRHYFITEANDPVLCMDLYAASGLGNPTYKARIYGADHSGHYLCVIRSAKTDQEELRKIIGPFNEEKEETVLAEKLRRQVAQMVNDDVMPVILSTSSTTGNLGEGPILLVQLYTVEKPEVGNPAYIGHVDERDHNNVHHCTVYSTRTGLEVLSGYIIGGEEKEAKPNKVEEKRRPVLGDPKEFNFEEGMVVELTNNAVAWHLHRLAAGYKLKNYVEGAEVMAGARGTVEQVLRYHTHPSTGEDEHLLAVSIDGISFLVPARYVRPTMVDGDMETAGIAAWEEKKAALGKAYGATDSVIQSGGKDPFPTIREEIPKDRKAPWMFHSFVFRLPDGKQIESPHVDGAVHKEDIPYDPWVPAVVKSGDENHLMVCGVTSAPFRIDFSRPEVKCWAKDMVPILVGEQAHLVTWRVWQAPPEEKEDTCSGNTILAQSLW